jgi:hypothetical protein
LTAGTRFRWQAVSRAHAMALQVFVHITEPDKSQFPFAHVISSFYSLQELPE